MARTKVEGRFVSTVTLRSGEVLDVEVEYTYSPPTENVWYLRNGDPGSQGDPEEAIIVSLREVREGGRVLAEEELSEPSLQKLEERISTEGLERVEQRYDSAQK